MPLWAPTTGLVARTSMRGGHGVPSRARASARAFRKALSASAKSGGSGAHTCDRG
jgi:hypothetical protein